jgi:SAM-dependent methyltransferase
VKDESFENPSGGVQTKWDERYRRSEHAPPAPRVLTEALHLLPDGGHALDLACGIGNGAKLLARSGLETWAWDISPVAIARLRQRLDADQRVIHAEVRDVVDRPPPAGSFDVILVSHFLERALIPALIDALRPGGLILYQTFVREAVSNEGPRNQAFRLRENELLDLFRSLRILLYREEGRVGDCSRGIRDIAMLVAQKPAASSM